MVLNGDILEYENVGLLDVDVTSGLIDVGSIEMLIQFLEFLSLTYSFPTMRLSGGGNKMRRQSSWTTPPIRAPIKRTRHWMDQMDIDSTHMDLLMSESTRYPGSGRRYVEGLGADTVSPHDYPWRAPMSSPLSAEGRAANSEYFRNLSNKAMYGNAVAATGYIAYREVKRLRERPFRSDQNDNTADNSAHSRVDINLDSISMSGRSMLSWKNKLTRKLKTHMEYHMSTVLVTQLITKPSASSPFYSEVAGQANHSTYEGTGPHLYSTMDDSSLVTGNFTDDGANPNTGNRYMDLWEVEYADSGFNVNKDEWSGLSDAHRIVYNRSLGVKSTVYIFVADWPGVFMNPLFATQVDYFYKTTSSNTNNISPPPYVWSQGNGNLLKWKYVPYHATTDANLPVILTDIFTNPDWSYLTHYYTRYNFKFRNTSRRNYCVEVMFFTFKADYNTFNYNRMCLAVVNRQNNKFQDYIDGISAPPADINVVYRKRLMLKGLNDIITGTSNDSSDKTGASVLNWRYVVKRQYVIKRPIVNSIDITYDEQRAFNEYYEFEKGLYCRMQAWPLVNEYVNAFDHGELIRNYKEDVCNIPTTTAYGTKIGFGVDVKIDKKSYFKLDEPMYKAYVKNL